jgi:Protein kinase domain
MRYILSLTDEFNANDVAFAFDGETGEAVDGDAKVEEAKEGVGEGMPKTVTVEPALKPCEQISISHKGSTQVITSMSPLSSGYIPARQPYLGSSSTSTSRPGRESPAIPRRQRHFPAIITDMNLDNVEIIFLRTVARARIPIAVPEDIRLDCVDRSFDTLSRHGATMQVHKGTWKGRKAAIKYIRRGWFPDEPEQDDKALARAYRQDMYDLDFELQILSKPSLREHPNITQLLAVCFDAPSEKSERFRAFPGPGLILELAQEQYPDLASFFDDNNHPERPHRLPYETSASLIADIADGVQVLHDHSLVHADLKPRNILLFPNDASRCGLTAKICDFGFAGMVTYTGEGERRPSLDGLPRGGTPEWNAPEFLKSGDPFNTHTFSPDHPEFEPSRDIYSFGLLTVYIALDGQSPKQYVQNLADVKHSGKMLEAATFQIEHHYPDEIAQDMSLKSAAIGIARETLILEPQARAKSLRSLEIRKMLFNDT